MMIETTMAMTPRASRYIREETRRKLIQTVASLCDYAGQMHFYSITKRCSRKNKTKEKISNKVFIAGILGFTEMTFKIFLFTAYLF